MQCLWTTGSKTYELSKTGAVSSRSDFNKKVRIELDFLINY